MLGRMKRLTSWELKSSNQDRGTSINGPISTGHAAMTKHGQTRARRRACRRDCLAQSKLSAPGSEHASLYYHVKFAYEIGYSQHEL